MPSPRSSFESFLSDPSRWDTTVPFLINHIKIPDLSTRHGLRKAYSQIDRISTELDVFYQMAKARRGPLLLASVVIVMMQMCTDSILKEKLFEKGLLEKIIDLLEYDLTRHMGLRILVTFIHDGSRMQGVVLEKIARHSRSISRLVQSWGSNERNAAELAVVVMAHSVRFYAANLAPDAGHLLLEIGLYDILRGMFVVLRRPHPSKSLVTHTLMLLLTPVQYFPTLCRDDAALNTLLVALFRAKDISIRVTALEGLLSICTADSEPDSCDIDLQHLATAVEHAESSPTVPIDLISSETHPQWVRQSESWLLYSLSDRYIEAMSQAARDQDLVALGRRIADIMQRSPMVVEGRWSQLQEDVGSDRQASDRLPFVHWSEALPECAKALRRSGTSSDLDAADILDIKSFMLHGRIPEAIALAQTTSTRNPHHAYARYLVSLCGDSAEGLQAAEEGLKCPDVTPFLRKQLLWRAVELRVWKGTKKILTADAGDSNAQEAGLISLRAALEYTNTFLAEAEPDAHMRLTMLGWSFLLSMTLRGPELSGDLRELKCIRQGMEVATTRMDFFSYAIRKTRVHNAWNILARTHCSGAGAEHMIFTLTDQESLPDVYAALQKCSWCGALSAALKKCTGCGETQYCDANCQRPHWAEHKHTCNRRSRS
ncbi:hypothetical protein L227DRAFT_568580 [Lentinus tigrinus ALCF2SS1-6]|uniref:MYND-type domain-containing protein n=1 Tax=Lentinus tigrinus ALCF2SS1-6 TaxID=1328759 RepID=A0A5C2RPU1_9APHY|nr:hypothetical protein L227DRAFT_568580 [Lentinus tigrinus ALCF2SS1-6]